jgi:MATE family multidrug resistance protein
VLFSIWYVLWTFYWGWGLALQVRVGTHLGDGNVEMAMTTTMLSVQIVLVAISTIAAAVYLGRHQLVMLFTNDAEVVRLAAGSMHVLVLDYIVGCMQLCGANVLEGMCRNNAMALISSFGTWGVMVPAALYFCFGCLLFKGREIQGLWFGSVLGSLFKCVLLWAVVATTDWKEMSIQARERSEAEEGGDSEGGAADGKENVSGVGGGENSEENNGRMGGGEDGAA